MLNILHKHFKSTFKFECFLLQLIMVKNCRHALFTKLYCCCCCLCCCLIWFSTFLFFGYFISRLWALFNSLRLFHTCFMILLLLLLPIVAAAAYVVAVATEKHVSRYSPFSFLPSFCICCCCRWQERDVDMWRAHTHSHTHAAGERESEKMRYEANKKILPFFVTRCCCCCCCRRCCSFFYAFISKTIN